MTTNLEHKTIEQYIKFLDAAKIYFLESDVNKIKGLLKGIYKNLQKQSCGNIITIHKMHLKRIKERKEFAQKFLNNKYKFNSKEKLLLDNFKEKNTPKLKLN